MRLLHTSDWHLGRTLHGVDLLDHQAAFLDHLVEVVRAERVDAVLVAGDVYDRAVPPVEAVTLLSQTLARLAETTSVVLASGNHDSATRLGFGAELMREQVHVRTRVAGLHHPVRLLAGESGALVYALPYLDPDAARAELAGPMEPAGAAAGPGAPAGTMPARSHAAVLGAAMARVRADREARSADEPVVVMAHAFVVGGEVSDSERDIRVGGVDSVPASVFAGADYLALGHLHGPQRVGERGRYSGSPLAYSFSERHHVKSTALVELGPGSGGADGGPAVRLLPAPVPRRLAEVTGTLEELLGRAGDAHVDDWVRVVVTDDARPADLMSRVRRRFPHALVVLHRPAAVQAALAAHPAAGLDPLEVAAAFVRHVTGAGPTPAELAALRAGLEAALAEQAGI